MTARRATLLVLLALAFPGACRAQFHVRLKFEHSTVLQFETAHAFVTLLNDTAETVSTDAAIERQELDLRLRVEDQDGHLLPQRKKGKFGGEQRLPPGATRQFIEDIDAWYDIVRPGRYRVTVDASVGPVRFASRTLPLQVVPGLTLKSIERQLPGYADRIRRYELRYWKRDKSEHLFLRVDEDDGAVNYGVFDLGRLLRVEPPTIAVERDGTVKVVHQSARACYTHSTFKSETDAVRFVDQTYRLPNGDPYPNVKRLQQ